MTMAAILRLLPQELLDAILAELDWNPRDLAALRMVNRRFYEIIGPSVFFKRVIIRGRRKNLESVLYVSRNPDYACCVQEVVVEIYPHGTIPNEDDCMCLSWMSDRLFSDGKKCMPKPWRDLLAEDERRVVFPNLKKLTAMYPDKYEVPGILRDRFLPVEVPVPEAQNRSLRALHARFRPSMCYALRSLDDLADWAYRCVRGVPEYTGKAEAPIIEVKGFPMIYFSQYGDLMFYDKFAHVEKLEIGLSVAQIYDDGLKVLRPSAIRSMQLKLRLAMLLHHNFHNLESLHVYGPPEIKQLYLDWGVDMTISRIDWLTFTINIQSRKHYPRRALKELVLEDFALSPPLDVLSRLRPLPDRIILKNCFTRHSPASSFDPAFSNDGSWKGLFEKLSTYMIENANVSQLGSSTALMVYGGPSGEVEGHPSAFVMMTPTMDSEIPSSRHASVWRRGQTYVEENAPQAYWKYQELMKSAKRS